MALAITQMSVLPELMCLYKKRLLNQAKNKEYSLAPKLKELIQRYIYQYEIFTGIICRV